MRDFLDTSVLIEACLTQSPRFADADAMVKAGAVTSAHALAEAYATLSGDARLRISPQAARAARCDVIHTLNVRHFQHVSPDLIVQGL